MTFNDCDLYCDIFNNLGMKIEEVTLVYEKKAHRSNDPRMKEIGNFLYHLAQRTRSEIRKELLRFEGGEQGISG